MLIRELATTDIDDILIIHGKVYPPELMEEEDIFTQRIGLYPTGCLGALEKGSLVGYVISHPWQSDSIVPLHVVRLQLPKIPDCLYIHDIAVLPTLRKRGYASQLVMTLLKRSEARGINRFVLVAVQDSEPFWSQWGFEPRERFRYANSFCGTKMIKDVRADSGL